MVITISAIHVYPIKSCGGIFLSEAVLDRRGIQYDRNWMVVDGWKNTFLSQRTYPKLALVKTAFVGKELHVTADGFLGGVTIPLYGEIHYIRKREVTVHKDICVGLDLGAHAAAWFSEYLGIDCALVRFHEKHPRPVHGSDAEVGFADAYPLLGISEASLADLNTRMVTPLSMDRFRPNLVFSGCDPYAEDAMRIMKVGDVRIEGKKPCARCKITTIDQQTAATGKEPLRTLATYRRVGNNVMFGMNFVHLDTGVIRAGDTVEAA